MKNKLVYDGFNQAFTSLLCQHPQAYAQMEGSKDYKSISGIIKFYQTANGTLVYAVITGLPDCTGFHGFHIHSGKECSGNSNDSFANAKLHYNPNGSAHPNHAGDLPPLINNGGFAFSSFLTNRFTVEEIMDKTVIIHENPDDFTTAPSGKSGEKIACGIITSVKPG